MKKDPIGFPVRPVFLNLAQIQLPVGALTSILHRITGVCLAVGVPFAVYLLDLSLRNQQAFARVTGLFGNHAFKAAMVFLIWTLAHHILAGIRHMLTDVNVGSTLHSGRRSAWSVNIGGLALGLLAAGAML
ncbi:MAG: succinate dehydrogenase, cytochrome b556 subunit [Polaromonas sp.]|uniref:succinate dehydrogenase, cytochrome b556 subunit n=1 Tax=Polaromonas sp. TaxID=1869339 RepID=UPI0024899F5B|nr:succinate dehydrogenase, cytochrome b556 subunit [Polaromonas sp.]MDI1269994.1 succinate dehydrogenase, cytochrome b556 subunit [Polaromonas sp.]